MNLEQISKKQVEPAEIKRDWEYYIEHKCSWEKLPNSVQLKLGSNKLVYENYIRQYSIEHQLRWSDNLISKIGPNEETYYNSLIEYSIAHYMLYPYHISDVLIGGFRITPFKYYHRMMWKVMASEKPYDSIPNFTASDCVRILGIGRNQFIEIMNQCRGRSIWPFKKKNSQIKGLLPSVPSRPSSEAEPWWIVHLSSITDENLKNSSPNEKKTLEILSTNGPQLAKNIDFELLHILYSKGLVYFQVPIIETDYITIPPLKNFVMNRISNDYFEKLLYKIFIAYDERLNVRQIADLLGIDENIVKNAISIYCRLHFAKKKNPFNEKNLTKFHKSWSLKMKKIMKKSKSSKITQDSENENENTNTNTNTNKENNENVNETNSNNENDVFIKQSESEQSIAEKSDVDSKQQITSKRIAIFFDSSLPAFLMGNLTQGLKSHAVTLFEVGKITNDQIDLFLNELDKVDSAMEGEAKQYFEHAITLRETLRFFRNMNISFQNEDKTTTINGLDLIRSESVACLESDVLYKFLNRNYGVVFSIIPLTFEIGTTISLSNPIHFGAPIPEINSPWFRLFLYSRACSGPPSLFLIKGTRLKKLPKILSGYTKISIMGFNREVLTFTSGNILPHINDNLVASPILVQALESETSQYKELAVPFPLKEPTEEEMKMEIKESEYNESNMHLHPVLRKVQEELSLEKSLGIIIMIYVPKLHVVENFDENQNLNQKQGQKNQQKEFHWVPLDIQFGIPIFNTKHNAIITQKMKDTNFLSQENLQLHLRNMRILCLRFLKFISSFCEPESPFNFSPKKQKEQENIPESVSILGKIIPLPSKHVLFSKNKITSFSQSETLRMI
ncbi:protein fam91a1 [Anaeramoeba ignava]|uniref:Protein fam91a1 n=1 Tax=Anaeramoeba ignava TaxID=1746090 RepID=A0A9Q0LAW9_ANAIG|nr:protein fam91a1 [Anaeramoeba ignava]